MTDVQREALAVLGEVWALSPDVRLGQWMAHLGFLGEAHVERGLGTIEDDELIAVMYRHKAELVEGKKLATEFKTVTDSRQFLVSYKREKN